jgi:hypothetical protein
LLRPSVAVPPSVATGISIQPFSTRSIPFVRIEKIILNNDMQAQNDAKQ